MQLNSILLFIFPFTIKECFILAIGVLASWLFTRYYYKKGISKPRYEIRSDYISSKEFDKTGILIKHGEQIIHNLTISRLALWNKGNRIKKEEIAESNPIAVKINTGTIIGYQILYSNEDNNLVPTFDDDGKRLIVGFDFLAKDQGFVLKIFHTGNPNEIKVDGTFIDGKKISDKGESFSRKMISQTNKKMRSFRRMLPYVNLITSLIMIIICLVCLYYSIFDFDNDQFRKFFFDPIIQSVDVKIQRVFIIVLYCFLIVPFSFMAYMSVKLFRRVMPKEVEDGFFCNTQKDIPFVAADYNFSKVKSEDEKFATGTDVVERKMQNDD